MNASNLKDQLLKFSNMRACTHGTKFEKVARLILLKIVQLKDPEAKITLTSKKTKEGITAIPDAILTYFGEDYLVEIKCPVDKIYMDFIRPEYVYQVHMTGWVHEKKKAVLFRCSFKENEMDFNRYHGWWIDSNRTNFHLIPPNEYHQKPEDCLGWTCKDYKLKWNDVKDVRPYLNLKPRVKLSEIKNEIIKRSDLNIDVVELFWKPISNDDLILLDDKMIRFLGYSDKKMFNSRTTIKRHLKKIGWNKDRVEVKEEPCKNAVIIDDPSKNAVIIRGRRKSYKIKTPLVNPDEFKHLCLSLKSERGKQVRQYFIQIEKMFKKVIIELAGITLIDDLKSLKLFE